MTLSLNAATRKALIAGGLVLSLGAAVPVQAADSMQFGFSFGGNSNSGFSFSLGNGGHYGRHFNQPQMHRVCLSDRQLRNQLSAQGYYRISFEGEHRGWVRASARKGQWHYQFDVNRCNGSIADLSTYRGHRSGGYWNGYSQ